MRLHTRKRHVLIALVTLLAATVPSSVSAQSGNHIVEVDVQDITEFDISGDVTLTFNEANNINGVDNRTEWKIEDQSARALSSASASTKGEYANYSIATNREGLKLVATGFSYTDVNVEELELAVRLKELDGEQRPESFVTLTEVGMEFSGGITVAENLGPVDESGNTLSYYGIVTPDFDPSQDGNIRIFYTLTSTK